MKFIIRKQLLNRSWSAADLDAAAEFWLRLYETAAKSQKFTTRPDHITEVRLRGFPRAEGPILANEFARRAAASEFCQPRVELHDPDTLVLSSSLTHPAEAPPHGLGLPLLAGLGFDGLMVEFRVTAIGGEGKLLGSERLSFTMVLVGQIIGGVFVLQAMWRSGSAGWEDDLCWFGEWSNSAAWITAFDRFRDTGEVPAKLAKTICVSRGTDRLSAAIVKLINVPLGKPRLAGLAWRWLVFALVFGGMAGTAVWLASEENWFGGLFLIIATWWILLVFWHFLRNEMRLWFTGYRAFHARYSALQHDPRRLISPPPELAAKLTHNPTVQKYTADLQAAGFIHAGDLITDPQSFGENVYRVFRAPDGVTHFSLLFAFTTASDPDKKMHMWPAQVALIAHTLFADGGYAVSINGRTNGYRRKRSGPDVLMRVFPDETDPLEFVRKHTKATSAFAETGGHRALPNGNFTDYVRRQETLMDMEQRSFAGSPYTWSDHLRWYLQTPRQVFRE